MRETTPLIGIVGNDVPRQLVRAVSAQPHRVTGSWTGDLDVAASELLGAADAVVSRILADLLAGPGELDALIICNDNQSHLRLYYALRAIGTDLPLHLLDFPDGRSAPARKFAEGQYRALVEFCAGITGRRADATTLRAAADEEQALGLALARLRDARRAVPSRCSGSQALELYLTASRLHPSDAIVEIDTALGSDTGLAASTGAVAEASSKIRVHMTGSSHPNTSVYRALEDRGCIIVGEDHDAGERAWLGEAVFADSLDGVIAGLVEARFARVSASSGAFSAARAELTATMVAQDRAQAVGAFVRELDEAPLWDLTDQAASLDGLNVPLRVRTRVGPNEANDAAAQLAIMLTGKAAEE